jgi:hypothetical protein
MVVMAEKIVAFWRLFVADWLALSSAKGFL